MTVPVSRSTIYVFSLIFLVALAGFIPKWFRQRTFEVPTTVLSTVPKQVSLKLKVDRVPSPSSIPRRAFRSLDSKSEVTLDEILASANRPILINFWATWCAPCLDELPSLEALSRLLERQPASSKAPLLVAVSVDERREEILESLKGFDFRSSLFLLHDKKGHFARMMGTSKFPETYLVDGRGRVLKKWIGPQDWLAPEIVQEIAAISSRS